MPSYSIRHRLTVLLLSSVAGLLLVAMLVLYFMVSQRLQAEYDLALLAKARALVTLTEQDEEGVELDFADEFMPEFEAAEVPDYFQLWFVDGSVLERSTSLAERDLAQISTRSTQAQFRDLSLPDGRHGRLVQITFLPHIDDDEKELLAGVERPELTLVVARGREALDTLLFGFIIAFIAVSAVLMLLIVLVVRFTVPLGLRPLTDMRQQIEGLDADSLASRLHLRQPTLELDAVVTQINALLLRLESAFQRERQFSSDVAHELRTPLAELRSLCEVGLQWPQDQALVEDFFQEVLAASLQMERIVVNLLALARCEKGVENIEKTDLDLVLLIQRAWQRVAPEATQKQLHWQWQGPATLMVHSGCDQLELILNNLFSNAVSYSPPNSTISCSISRRQADVELSVANRTEHLQASDLPLLFDRLWRKDNARTDDDDHHHGHHAGLGLTLVKAYVEQLKLAVQVALEPGPTFRITLSGAL